MNQFKNLTYFLVLLCAFSCKVDVPIEDADFEHKLVVIAELEADVAPEFIISTTYDLTSEPEILPENTRVVVFDVDNPGEPNSFRQDLKSPGGIKWNPPGQFIPRLGKEYEIVVDVSNLGMDMEPIIATAKVPMPGDIESMAPVSYIEQEDYTTFNISINLQTPPDEENFYHLIPNIKIGGEDVTLDILDIEEGINSAFVLSHRDGMLIDVSRLNENKTLTFKARSLVPVNVAQMVNPRMFYTLKTVSAEYYNYHQNISRSNFTNLGPFTLPVITYSQFIDEGDEEPYGYGVFSALSNVVRSVEIK